MKRANSLLFGTLSIKAQTAGKRLETRWRELYPDARQVVIPKGNHFPMCDDPESVADRLRDWRQSVTTSQFV